MNLIEFGDCRETMRRWALQGIKAQTCVTSPPYFGLRDYGVDGQIGLEQTPEEYIAAMVEVFRCVRDVLADDGTLWVNIGDSYARDPGKGGSGPGGKNTAYSDSYTDAARIRSEAKGSSDGKVGRGDRAPVRVGGAGLKPKDLIGIPWMLAFALRADGWYLRQDIIWHKPNPMPESVRDRCTKAHEYVFLLSKSERYFFDIEAMKEPAVGANLHDVTGRSKQRGMADTFKRKDSKRAQVIPGQSVGTHREDRAESTYDVFTRNRRSVWTVATRPYKGAHFATFPPALIEPCILAGSRPGDIVLDPFMGSGTTAAVAIPHGRQYLGCELNPEYGPLQQERIAQVFGDLA
jgi:DNA modification methylase